MLTATYLNRGVEAIDPALPPVVHDGMRELLDRYNPGCGPIRKVVTYLGCSPMLPVDVGHCEYFDFDHVLRAATGLTSLDTGVQSSLFAGGKGSNLMGMFISSLGETIERVLGSLYFYQRLRSTHRFGTYRQLTSAGLRCLGPEEMPLFAPEQYAEPDFYFEPFTADSLLGWMPGRRLFSGEEIWVPAQLVELVYTRAAEEAVIGYSASGGLASHVSMEDALYHGITELIERDAANLRWYSGVAPDRVVFDRPVRDRRTRAALEHAQSLPGEMNFYSHGLDIDEVVVLTCIKFENWLRRASYNAGGGGDLDMDVCIQKALNEYGQSERTMLMSLLAPERIFAEGVQQMFDTPPDTDVRNIQLFFQIISFYGYQQNRAKLAWYLAGSGRDVPYSELPSVSFDSARSRFEFLLGVLKRHRIDPIVFDFDPPGMRRIRLVKVFIPELTQPFLQSRPILGHPRFANAMKLLGRGTESIPYRTFVTDPLPYP